MRFKIINSLRINLLRRKLFSEFFIGSNAEIRLHDKIIIPHRLLLLLVPAIIVRTYHVYFEEKIRNVPYLLLDPTLFLIGIFVIYPSVSTFFDSSDEGYLKKLFSTLDSLSYIDSSSFNFSKFRSNVYVFISVFVLWIIWIVGLITLGINLTPALVLITIFYMIFWIPVFSAVHYIVSITKFAERALEETNISNFKLKDKLKSLLGGNPIKKFISFKKALENIFTPIITVVIRTILAITLPLLGIIYILFWKSCLPQKEFLGVSYAAFLILAGSLVIFSGLVYVVIRISINLRELILTELKELKLEMATDQKNFLVFQEIDNLLSDISILLMPSKVVLNVILTFLTIIGTLLTLLQYVFQRLP